GAVSAPVEPRQVRLRLRRRPSSRCCFVGQFGYVDATARSRQRRALGTLSPWSWEPTCDEHHLRICAPANTLIGSTIKFLMANHKRTRIHEPSTIRSSFRYRIFDRGPLG